MRSASAALQNYLAANDTLAVIDLYTFALQSGEVLRYSGWATPLSIPGTLFPIGSLNFNATQYTVFALGPRFGRSTVTTKIGIEPTELDLSILAGADDPVGRRALPMRFAPASSTARPSSSTASLHRRCRTAPGRRR